MSKNVIKKIEYNGIEYEISQGGSGGGAQIVEITSAEYRALTDEQKNDTSKIYVIKDGESEYYKKNEVYNKTESDAKYSLKGEGKVYTGASGVTVNNDTNVIGVNAVSGLSRNTYTNYDSITYTKTTGSTSSTLLQIRGLTVNGTKQYLTGTTLLDLDSVYAKTSDIPDTSNFATKDEIPTVPTYTYDATTKTLNITTS